MKKSNWQISKMLTKYVLLIIALVHAAYCYLEGRIVNGTKSTIEKFPFMVALRSSQGSQGAFCGASIIAPRWILTAGHCVIGLTANAIILEFASTELDAKSLNLIKVKRIVLHENYSYLDTANDIALLELYGQLVFNYKAFGPVALPRQNFEIPQIKGGVPGVLAGWGANITFGNMQSVLHEVDLKIYSDEECMQRHRNDILTVNHICAGTDEGWKDQCNGDSGGPLLYQRHIQLGIVSWSMRPCGRPPYPGVYTKVSHYIDWIRKNCDSCI